MIEGMGEGVDAELEALRPTRWRSGPSPSSPAAKPRAAVIEPQRSHRAGYVFEEAVRRMGRVSRTTPPVDIALSLSTPITRCEPRAEALAPTLLYKQRPPDRMLAATRAHFVSQWRPRGQAREWASASIPAKHE